jgi:DNA polymerase-3 subunit epsilon
MLKNAPKFFEVAKRIVEITEGCIIVAHNALFDYRILCTEFRRLGFEYKRKSLCTVELSKYLIPEQPSYSLGKLVRALGIPVADRHRASGDAQATVKLFKLLLAKDSSKNIIKDAVRSNPKNQLEPKHLDIIASLPTVTGVYYIHNKDGDIIYIGKSNNIKKRINQHFTSSNPKSKKIQSLVTTVSYEVTGSELVALLKENEEIKKNAPLLNTALKRAMFTYGLYSAVDTNDYITLAVMPADDSKSAITTFTNKQSGKHFITKAVEDYDLCQKLTGLYPTTTSCFNYDIKACAGACLKEEPAEIYNKRVNALISKNSYANKNMVIIDKGRAVDERSAILIKDGVFAGLGFFNLNHQLHNLDILNSIITPMENNRDTQHIIQSYLRRHKKLKQIIFD